MSPHERLRVLATNDRNTQTDKTTAPGTMHSRPGEASAYKPIFALASSMSSSKAEAMAVSRSRVARWWIIAARVLERPILATSSFRVAPLSAYQVLPV